MAQTLLTESFNYTSGLALTATTNWNAISGTGINNLTVSNGNLSYAGSVINDMGNKISLTNNGQDAFRSFVSTSGSVYSSLIVKVSDAKAVGDYFYSLGTATTPTDGARLYIRSNGSGFSFGVLKGTGATPVYETTIRPYNTNISVVIKYEVITGSNNDAVKLYVNPTVSAEPAVPDAQHTAGADSSAFSAVALRQGTAANAPTLEVDGINVGSNWASVTSSVYDYGDVPISFDFSKDGVYVPAAQKLLSGLMLGSVIPDLELAPLSVAISSNNMGSNGDGTDEDAVLVSANPLKKGVAYTLSIPVINPSAATKYIYGWIDFNNDGKFQFDESADAVATFTATGPSQQTLTWSASKIATAVAGANLYMRIRLSDRSLIDFTAAGGALIDERSIGNGVVSATNSADHPTTANGEVEDYVIKESTIIPDSDGDGLKDDVDLDDDNDGILDTAEMPISLNDTSFKLYNTVAYTGASKWTLYITGVAGTQVTYTPVGGSPTTAVIPASQILNIDLAAANIPTATTNSVTSNRYVPVISTAPISILQEIYGSPTVAQDATVVYPQVLWGTNYTINTYYNLSSALNTSSFNIFSASDNNAVVVKNSAGTQIASFTLNEGENYIYSPSTSNTNINGYTVTSTKKVGVMVSVQCANGTAGACDNTVEYLLPNNFLGTKFLTRSYDSTSQMIITALQNGTTVRVNGTAVSVLNAGSTYIYVQNNLQEQVIETSNPVQFTKVSPYDSDPSVTTVQDITKATLGPATFIIPTIMVTANYITVYTKTSDTGKMLYNNTPITGWAAFSYDPTYSYVTLPSIAGGTLVQISSTTGDVPFLTDYYGKGINVSDATPLTIGSYDLSSGSISTLGYKDTDGDGIPNYLDLDSDNDGCLDALEGAAGLANSNLVAAGGTVTVGAGSSANNRNFCANAGCIDVNGIPNIIGAGGQAIGSSEDSVIKAAACLITYCYKPGITSGNVLQGKMGITSLGRAGANDADNWPMIRKGAWMVLESKTKGFVINRVPFDAMGNPVGIAASDFVEGMLVYDRTNNCLKIYTSTNGGVNFSWRCIATQACPD